MLQNRNEKHGQKRKISTLLVSLLVILTMTVGGTLAYLVDSEGELVNTFTPSKVTNEVEEDFDGRVKSKIVVKNTGDINAYIRVKLVSYRVNDKEQHIGGEAAISTFTLGDNWVKNGDYYYYTLPVEPNGYTVDLLAESIELEDAYTDADGGKQVIEVMSEAIQSEPARAVGEAWGVTIREGSVTAYSVN